MKNRMKTVLIPITIITLFVLSALAAFAQGQNPITATVNRVSLTTDDVVELTVSVTANGATTPNPALPALNGFNIVGTGTSQKISIVNGAMNTQVIHRYQLQPYQVGDMLIEPISVTLNGQAYFTQPIAIQVTQGNGMPSAAPAPSTSRPVTPSSTTFAGQDLYAEAEVDNPNPFLGEQITYTFRFYQAADNLGSFFDQPQFVPPAFSGFWAEGKANQDQYRVRAGERIYDVTELRTTLFPTRVGQVTLEPAQLSVPGSFFRRGGALQSQPVTVDVKPLPANAPHSFSGAVGQFTIDATVDAADTRVNEPVTWKVTISGQGNLNTMADPNWPEIPNLRSFESQATVNTQLQTGQIVGSRIYERLLVPQAEGEFVIPALEYTYFDPVAAAFRTITTQQLVVSAAPGDGSGAQPENYAATAPEIEQIVVEPVGMDIRHLKPVPGKLKASGAPITNSLLYWLAWAMPAVALAGTVVWQRRQIYRCHNAGALRSAHAPKKARQALARARKQTGENYNAAEQILTTYLSEKLNQPVLGLTQQVLTELLAAKGVSPELIERTKVCLMDAELGRYAPNAGHPDHANNLLNEIEILINVLEKIF